MEQPIGQNVKPTTPAAGTDPAFFPGLVPSQPAAPGKTGDGPEAAGDAIPAAFQGTAGRRPQLAKPDAAEDAESESPETDADAAAPAAVADADPETGAEAEAEDAGEEDVDDGLPVFEAADRRGAIIADRGGVTFTLDGETAEFGWDEIGAVEIDTPRFGKRFSVTVYTSARRWFQSDVEAPSRSRLKEWAAELDAVLDARFDDEKPEPERADGEPEAVESDGAGSTGDAPADGAEAETTDSASADA